MVYEGGAQGGGDVGGKRLYVGNINYDMQEDDMRAACSEHGRVASVMLKQGFAFVDFETTEGAEAARNALTGSVHRGRTLNVDFAGKPSRRDKGGGGNDDKRDMRSDTTGSFSTQGPRQAEGSSHSATRNLFVANIPSSMTEDDVKVYFKSCDGVQGNILNVKFLPKKSDTWAGFVDFEHMEDAIAVHQMAHRLEDNRLRTDFNSRAPAGGRKNDEPRGGGRSPPRDRGYERGYERRSPPRYDDRRGPPEYDRGYERGYERRSPPRYDDRRGPPEYDRGYERRSPPRYDDRRSDRRSPPRYDDRRGPPEYERGYERRDEVRYERREERRAYVDVDRPHEDYRGGYEREREHHDDRRYDERR